MTCSTVRTLIYLKGGLSVSCCNHNVRKRNVGGGGKRSRWKFKLRVRSRISIRTALIPYIALELTFYPKTYYNRETNPILVSPKTLQSSMYISQIMYIRPTNTTVAMIP